MKPGPIVAMVLLIFLGVWLVLQPALERESYDFAIRIGSGDVHVRGVADAGEAPAYRVVAPSRLAMDDDESALSADDLAALIEAESSAWAERAAIERMLLGFFNISSWTNFAWVLVGLGGQIAFFGRMLVQWVVSEKSRRSQVPELFWWLSFLGGVCLFTYFVWRVDVVGVLGQSTGVVIYARNLRLIQKQKRRDARPSSGGTPGGTPGGAASDAPGGAASGSPAQ